MVRVELPQSRLKARRRSRRRAYALVVSASALFLVAVAIGLSYLPFLQVRKVEVVGLKTLATSTVQNYVESKIEGRYLYAFPRRNIFLYPKGGIAEGLLSRFPELRSADVHAANFHTISANIIEREPKALWCSDDSLRCYVMDEDGLAYAQAPAEGYVKYQGHLAGGALPRQYASPDKFRALSALIDALSQTQPTPVERASIDAAGDVKAYFGNGFVLQFALNEAGGDVFERFKLALTSEPFRKRTLADFDYLDLRFGDKLYYKLK